MADEPPGDPLSEVGPDIAMEQQSTSNAGQIELDIVSVVDENDRWKLLFEAQQKTLLDLIKTIKEPAVNEFKLSLPEFNPDVADSDAQSWCNTADLCMAENPISGSKLIIVMSRALKGSAATWLAQNSFSGMTWPELKNLFMARFITAETPAAALYKILNETPKEGECLSAYANRVLSSLTSRWKNLTVEQIAIAVTLAHTAKIEPRLQRLAFTTDIDSRVKLQQELMAHVYRKRRSSSLDNASGSNVNEAKKPRVEFKKKCYNCGKFGHRADECRDRTKIDSRLSVRPDFSESSTSRDNNAGTAKKTSVPTCYRCGVAGHIATRCQTSSGKPDDAKLEHRVDICTVKPATDTLSNSDLDSEGSHEDM